MTDEKEINYQQQAEEYLAGWKRAQADYQNLRKELDREKAECMHYAHEQLLSFLLPAFDQFSTAMQHLPADPTDQKAWENWMKGMKAVQSLWDQGMKSVGLTRIPADGAFDPALHDAASEEVAEGQSAGTIIRTVTDGWKWKGKVLRPARVIVSSDLKPKA